MNTMLETLRVKSYAKINLYLRVLGKNGLLHQLFMINSLIDYYDEMDFVITSSENSSVETCFGDDRYHIGQDNLVSRAFYRCAPYFKHALSMKVFIKKNIPPGTGLGGGSGNAARVIEVLRPWLNPEFFQNELLLAKDLGSDVPFFLFGKPAYVKGCGEIIEALPFKLPSWWLLLVIPDYSCSTADVYRQYDQMFDPAEIFTPNIAKEFDDSSSFFPLVNDLYFPALQLEPRLRNILTDLRKTRVLDCAMSGSGSSCFGVYSEKSHAKEAFLKLSQVYPCCTVCRLLQDE